MWDSMFYTPLSLSQLYSFRKEPVPENRDEKLKMIESLMKFGVSITQYENIICLILQCKFAYVQYSS